MTGSDVSIRAPIAQYLRDCGYKVIAVVNADEAMTVVLDEETVIDVVFSDIDMPSIMDGSGYRNGSVRNAQG